MTKIIAQNERWYEAIHTVKNRPGERFLVTISDDGYTSEGIPEFFVRMWNVTKYPIYCFDDFQADFVRAIGAKQYKRPGDPAPDWNDVLDIGEYWYITNGIDPHATDENGNERYWYFSMKDALLGLKLHLKEL